MINNNYSPWLSIKEACNYLKCGRTKMTQMLHTGKIKYYRLTNNKKSSIRILKSDLNKYMIYGTRIRLNKSEKEFLKSIS